MLTMKQVVILVLAVLNALGFLVGCAVLVQSVQGSLAIDTFNASFITALFLVVSVACLSVINTDEAEESSSYITHLNSIYEEEV